MALDTWLAFFVASWIISLSPGAGAIASMSSGLQYGFLRGYWNAIGLQLGLAMQIAVVAGGLGAILAASSNAFYAIKWFGVAYLVYLAVKQWRALPRIRYWISSGACGFTNCGSTASMNTSALGLLALTRKPRNIIASGLPIGRMAESSLMSMGSARHCLTARYTRYATPNHLIA